MKGRSRNYIIMALLGLSVLGFGGLAAAADIAEHAPRLIADATLPPGDMSRGADNFYVSDKVDGKTVTFTDIYDMKVAGNLFVPKTLKAGQKLPAIIVGHPMGAVKEQSASLYAQKMAERAM